MQKITKAVLPVAGIGSRFLPATKANAKEMLPIVDKPLIQYAVEELVSAGITELIFITNRNKQSISDHFDKAVDLEMTLDKKGDTEKLATIQNIIPDTVNCIYVRQAEPLGLGHAVLCAQSVIGTQPFILLLPDDLIDDGQRGVVRQLIEHYQQIGNSIVAVENVFPEDISKYGIVQTATESTPPLLKINNIVEKPAVGSTDSTLAVVGRYLLTAEIFSCLEKIQANHRVGELQITDAISMLIDKEAVYAYQFEGVRYDCGSKLGYMQASVAYALQHTDIKDTFLQYLKKII